MYNVLKEIFDEYQDIFDYDSFHVGGDEVSLVFISQDTLRNNWFGIYDNVTGWIQYTLI